MKKTLVILFLLSLDLFGACWGAVAPKKVFGTYTISYRIPNSADQYTDTIVLNQSDNSGYFRATLQGPNVTLVGLAKPTYICMSMLNVTPTSFTYCFDHRRKLDRNASVIITYPIDASRNAVPRGAVFQALDSIQLVATVRKTKLAATQQMAK